MFPFSSSEIIPGEGFYHNLQNVFIGGYDQGDVNNFNAQLHKYRGYLQNIHIGGFDILDELHPNPDIIFSGSPPDIVFNDVTFPNYDIHVRGNGIGQVSTLNLVFKFKTTDEDGIILFNKGSKEELFAVELFKGALHVKVCKNIVLGVLLTQL